MNTVGTRASFRYESQSSIVRFLLLLQNNNDSAVSTLESS